MHRANLSSLLEMLEALEGTGVGAWGWDVDTNTIRWAANTGPLYGLERGFEPDSYETFLQLVHPDDRRVVAEAVQAALEHGTDYEIDLRAPWPDGSIHWLNARGHAVVDDGRTVRIVGVVSDATEKKRQAEQNRFLAEAGELLVGSLDVEKTLTQVADLLVAHIADWCSVQMVEGGKLRTTVVAHRDPEMVSLVEQLMDEYPPDPEPTGIARTVLDTGKPVLLTEIPDELLSEAASDERHLEILQSLGLHSALTVPIAARGRIHALMSLVSAESLRRFREADVAFAEEFARRAALALDNARLHQEALRATRQAERSSARLVAVNNVVSRLSQAADVTAVASAAVDEGVIALGANRGSVVLRGQDGPEIVASHGYSEERIAAFRQSVAARGPLADAMDHGVTVYCATIDELLDRYPNLADAMVAVTKGAFAAAPLRSVDGNLGAIGFVYENSRIFSDEDRALVEALAQHVSLAIERGMMFERSRSVAERLQEALAPPPMLGQGPVPAAARYRAAGVGAVGGDWYDLIDSPTGSQIYVIGDVVGRGLEAVATMAQLRHGLRMLILEGHPPAAALGALGKVAAVDTTALCSTVLCAEIEPASAEIHLTSAGHLPPVVVGHDTARLLEVPVGAPLGVDSAQPTHTVKIADDECLVLYTDGVVERRDRDIDTSLGLLCDTLRSVPPNADAIAEKLIELAGDADDDATILVIGGEREPAS